MNKPYTKFEEIEFQDAPHKVTAETILSDIDALQNYLITEEQYIEMLKQTIGSEYANTVACLTSEKTKRILLALKIAFWYYTGTQANKVIIDNQNNVNIFDIFDKNKGINNDS